jgi:Zn-dependent peptidase ImmA (M78 family)
LRFSDLRTLTLNRLTSKALSLRRFPISERRIERHFSKREIVNQEQWTQFIAANAGAKFREGMDKVYSAIEKLKLPVEFSGREKEIADLNRRIAESW